MKQRIARISVHQTSLVMAVLYLIIGLIMVPFIFLASLMDPDTAFPFWTMLIIPIVYAVIGYISVAIVALVYNFLASLTGGVEVTLKPAPDSSTAI